MGRSEGEEKEGGCDAQQPTEDYYTRKMSKREKIKDRDEKGEGIPMTTVASHIDGRGISNG